ncbi:acyl carrier protein [Teredinibacter waterburyi]|uniref:acyl carrier protein n=1 Tax=Teredinibacter waterburyi TaxID=1500538 RepID=UPI00165ED1BD|nr:acyl carrier protein [Teredinibacter waterburyi]
MDQSILETLKNIISRVTGKADVQGNTSERITDEYGLDSMQLVGLILGIEEHYGLVFGIDPNDMEALASLDSLSNWISSRV